MRILLCQYIIYKKFYEPLLVDILSSEISGLLSVRSKLKVLSEIGIPNNTSILMSVSLRGAARTSNLGAKEQLNANHINK